MALFTNSKYAQVDNVAYWNRRYSRRGAIIMPGGKVIAVLNMKGGVGKTTISAHVMRVLYHQNSKRMLLIDLDPQFNLTQCLMGRSAYDSLKKDDKTIFTAMEPPSKVGLFDVATSPQPTPAPAALAKRMRQFTDNSAYLDLVPGNFDLVKYSSIEDKGKLAAVNFSC